MTWVLGFMDKLQCVAMCCRMLQHVALRCSVLQHVHDDECHSQKSAQYSIYCMLHLNFEKANRKYKIQPPTRIFFGIVSCLLEI